MKILLASVVALTLSTQAPPPAPWAPKTEPKISYHDKDVAKPYFEVAIDKGAIWYCMVYTQLTDGVGPKGVEKPPYEPRKCDKLDGDESYFVETWDPIPLYVHDADWEVYANVGYMKPGSNEVEYRASNRIKVHQ